jgi:heterogeneous nuclear rnp K-like protein
MSASPTTTAAPSQKRPLEEPSSPNGPGDQPDAKRPALDKIIKEEVAPVAELVAEDDTSSVTAKTEPTPKAENGIVDGDTVVPDADAEAVDTSLPVVDGAPILNGAPNQVQNRHDESSWLHVRAIISSAEAATVIGKGGENVSLIRKMSAARCTVSDYARGAVERILTVSGQVDAVAKVCFFTLPLFIS